MISIIKKIINPIEILRAIWFHKNQKKHIKSSEDLELMLYSKIIRNDMLHYGYFDDIHIHPDTISIKDLENAQMKYVEIIIIRHLILGCLASRPHSNFSLIVLE